MAVALRPSSGQTLSTRITDYATPFVLSSRSMNGFFLKTTRLGGKVFFPARFERLKVWNGLNDWNPRNAVLFALRGEKILG